MLTLNLNLLWTVVNVLVLFLLLRKFLYRPVMNIIAERQKQVDDALAAAETSKSEAAAALNAAQDKLRNVDDEAAARRKAYEQQAEKEKHNFRVAICSLCSNLRMIIYSFLPMREQHPPHIPQSEETSVLL